jgi:S-adenosylmethionine synthetase
LDGRFGSDVMYHINAAWLWSDGWFAADAWLTGRKLAVDNYGPQIPVGGGAFSGKDWSKVDRSGAYIARYIACDYLRQYEDIQRVQVSIAYCIGVAQPVMVTIQTDQWVFPYEGYLDLTPRGIRDFLDLARPQFAQTARWWHFGHGFVREK